LDEENCKVDGEGEGGGGGDTRKARAINKAMIKAITAEVTIMFLMCFN
jgi:hypothetical protein